MTTVFNAGLSLKGGRSGPVQTPVGLLNLSLDNPLVEAIEERGPSPELLFAAACSTSYNSALAKAAEGRGIPIYDTKVWALVSRLEDDLGRSCLAVELHALLPGIDHHEARVIMEEAHEMCPYSKAVRCDTTIKLAGDYPARNHN